MVNITHKDILISKSECKSLGHCISCDKMQLRKKIKNFRINTDINIMGKYTNYQK